MMLWDELALGYMYHGMTYPDEAGYAGREKIFDCPILETGHEKWCYNISASGGMYR